MEEKLEEMLEEYHSYYDDGGDRVFNDYGVRELLKWHATQMYSEEDMREAFKANYTPFSATNIGDVEQDFQKWFEQYKKK